ncbi:SDR family NAD(P)-dependent oxidoreductase, partial [Micromonospora sp. DT231]|uniref:SDR family NAD(P)-dependent oxidoreductase n=1 Tax=Micromonospora sp. DT231 TaxID=3416526 RepID=UPI003CEC8B63
VVTLLTAVARLFVTGTPIAWDAIVPAPDVESIPVAPTYPFQRERFWIELPAQTRSDAVDAEFWAAVERGDLGELAAVVGDEPTSALEAALPALSRWRQRTLEQSRTDSWRYRITWTPTRDRPSDAPLPGTWLVVHPTTPVEVLPDLAERTVELTLDAATDGRAAIAERLAAIADDLTGVISYLGLDDLPHPGQPALTTGLAATLALVQALGDAGVAAPLWCLTRSAVSTGSADRLSNPVQAQLWGLGRVVALEHPERWGGLVDLPAEPGARTAERVRAAIRESGEDQLAVRESGTYVRRLARAVGGVPVAPWQPRGTVLITGGTGALGSAVARKLATEGVERLVLTSRQGTAAPGAPELAVELAATGVAVTIEACDVADRTALAAVVERHAPTAVVHTAGVGRYTALDETTLDDFAAVTAGKVRGAANLDALLTAPGLEALVLFSSVAGVWGSGGQGAYAAANAYLDALAEQWRADGRPAVSVGWGPWDGGGMAEGSTGEQLLRQGLRPMAVDPAVAAMRRAVAEGVPALAVADVDWERFAPTFTFRRPSALLGDLPEVGARDGGDTEPEAGAASLLDELAARNPAEQERELLRVVRAEVAAVLGHASADTVDEAQAFRDAGFDSLTAVELRNRLGAAFGTSLPATVVFDHPTPRDLAGFLRGLLPGAQSAGEQAYADLERAAELLADSTPDNVTRARITMRLQAMLASLTETVVAPVAAPAADLDRGTDQDIFDFINNELGRS